MRETPVAINVDTFQLALIRATWLFSVYEKRGRSRRGQLVTSLSDATTAYCDGLLVACDCRRSRGGFTIVLPRSRVDEGQARIGELLERQVGSAARLAEDAKDDSH